ncbi:hypothetical protein ACOZ4I_15270 [Haloarcula salina]|uniref:hypothetical protein n=1 Tax=Haloarcula salina TaxID=1429914 RepID=UPI003C6F606C
MRRRQFVRCVGVVGAGALTGCLGDDSGTGETPTDQSADGPTVTDTQFTVTGRASGTQVSDATISFEDERIVVEGTIWGANGCKTAELVDAAYDGDADELTVAVAVTDREGAGGGCTQAIVEIDYRAVVTVDGGLPGSVTVTHDHGDGPSAVATVTL